MPATVPCQVSPISSSTETFLTALQYRTGKTLGSGTYAIVKEAIHVGTGKYYACKVINKRLMEGREHMVISPLRPIPVDGTHPLNRSATRSQSSNVFPAGI